MLIDWFTLIAQFLNFLLLVWLLKRFLYKPIMNAVDQRERSIEEQLENAKNQIVLAETLNSEYKSQLQNFNQKRETLMAEAVQEASQTKQKLLEATKKELSALDLKQKASLKDQEDSYQNILVRRAQTEIFQIAKKTLMDLSSEEIEKHMFRVFLDRLNALSEEELEKLAYTLADSHYRVVFKSSYDLDESQKNAVTGRLNELASHHVTTVFVLQSDLINGFQLMTGDFKLSWNIEEYLMALYKESLPSSKAAIHVKPEVSK